MDFTSRKKRGLSSIVGTLFFLVLLVGAFTALLAAFSYQNSLIDTQKSLADLQVAKSRENFVITAAMNTGTCTLVAPNNNCLDVTVNNKGTNTVEVAKLWVIEKVNADGDGNSYEATAYDSSATSPLQLNFNDLIVPVATAKKITTNLIPVNSADSNGYRIKVVSKLGTIVSIDIPDTSGTAGPQGQKCWDLNNNQIGDLVLSPPVVINGVTYTTEDTDGSGVVNILDCKGPPGNQGDDIVLDPRFLQKPEIFLTFPSPFGLTPTATANDPYQGLWGVTVANPTDNDMYVSKIVITATSPRANSQDNIINSPCVYTAVTAPTSAWVCASQNQITWKNNVGLGTLISPRTASMFFITVKPGTLGSAPMETMPITASVFTTMGQFGKTGYASSMRETSAPIVNVYVTNTLTESSAVLSTGMDVTFIDINAKTGQLDLKVALAELNGETGSSSHNYIKQGAKLIINVPKVFSNVVVGSHSGFDSPVVVTPYSDGSTQIVATLSADLGDTNAKVAKILEFTATPDPTITQSKMYLIPILGYGDGCSDVSGCATTFEIGPEQEYIVRLHP